MPRMWMLPSERLLTRNDPAPALPGSWLPAGAVIYADFINDHYWAGGAETTLNDIFLLNTDWGDQVYLTKDGNGVKGADPVINQTYGNALLAGGITIVYEGMPIGPDVGSSESDIIDLPNFDNRLEILVASDADPQANGNGVHFVSATSRLINDTIQKWAVVLTQSKMALCVSGGTVESLTPGAPGTAPTHIGIYFAGYLRTMTIYSGALSDAQLQAKTA